MGSGRVCLLQKDGNQLTWKVGVSGARLVPPAQPRAARGPTRRTGSPLRGCLWRSPEIVVHQNSGRGSAGVGRCAHWGQTAQTYVLTVLEAESRRSRWRPRLSLLGVGAATFALGPHLVISLLVYVQVSPFYRDPSQVGTGPSLVTSF